MTKAEVFYRLFGVFKHGGTVNDGQMLEIDQVPEKIAEWLSKQHFDELLTITIVKVIRE